MCANNKNKKIKMANNKVQAQEIESLNIHEAFFLKYKKAILIAVVARCVRLFLSDLWSS